MTATRISHLFVFANLLQPMVTFYCDVLGFEVLHRGEDGVFLRLPGDATTLAIYEREHEVAVETRNWMLVIDVDDVKGRHDLLHQWGVSVSPVTEVPYGTAVELSDPEGNRIELHQPVP